MLSVVHLKLDHDLFEIFEIPVFVHAIKLIVQMLRMNQEVLLEFEDIAVSGRRVTSRSGVLSYFLPKRGPMFADPVGILCKFPIRFSLDFFGFEDLGSPFG